MQHGKTYGVIAALVLPVYATLFLSSSSPAQIHNPTPVASQGTIPAGSDHWRMSLWVPEIRVPAGRTAVITGWYSRTRPDGGWYLWIDGEPWQNVNWPAQVRCQVIRDDERGALHGYAITATTEDVRVSWSVNPEDPYDTFSSSARVFAQVWGYFVDN